MVVAGCGWGTRSRAIECATGSSASSSCSGHITSSQQRCGGRSVHWLRMDQGSHAHQPQPKHGPTLQHASPSQHRNVLNCSRSHPRHSCGASTRRGPRPKCLVRRGRSSPATPAHRSRPQATQSADARAVLVAVRVQASSAQGCGSAVAVELAGRSVPATPCSCSEVRTLPAGKKQH